MGKRQVNKLERMEAARRWAHELDVGLSSQTMISAALGEVPPVSIWGETDHPLDPSDLGRCLRLQDRLPWVSDGFGVLKQHSVAWTSLLDIWGELRAMLESEVDLYSGEGTALKTYDLMEEALRGD